MYDVKHVEMEKTLILCGNILAIALSKNNGYTGNKHIYTHYHFMYELVNNDDITLHFFGIKGSTRIYLHQTIGKTYLWISKIALGYY